MTRISKSMSSKITKLIQAECCNYISGECLLCSTKCAQIARVKPGNLRSDQAFFICPWFLDAVLPLNKELQQLLLSKKDKRKCANCGRVFIGGSNRAKYCSSCAAIIQKMLKREYAQRKRYNL